MHGAQSVSGMATVPLKVNPDACHPTGAYTLFVQIVGVLGVSHSAKNSALLALPK